MKRPASGMIHLLILIAGTLLGASCQLNKIAGRTEALRRVAAQPPGIFWALDHAVRVDINDDGRQDYAVVGTESGRVVCLAVVLGPVTPQSPVHRLDFGIGSCQPCVQQLPVYLTTESMDYDPRETTLDETSGFHRSRTASGVNISDGLTDSLHIFWNHNTRTIDWWRL